MGRTNLVVNYTRHGLAAIDEQKRVGMLKLEQAYNNAPNPQGIAPSPSRHAPTALAHSRSHTPHRTRTHARTHAHAQGWAGTTFGTRSVYAR
jgi:hypothetical protein